MSYAGREKMAHDLQVSLEIGYFTMASTFGNILNVQYQLNLTNFINKKVPNHISNRRFTHWFVLQRKFEIYEKKV